MSIETTDQTGGKKTPTRLYRVNNTLIRATTPAQAVHHLAKRTIECRVATQDDIVELRDLGFEIQEAGSPWKENPKPVEVTAKIHVGEGVPEAMVRAATEAAAVPGATEREIEGAALAAVQILPEGRTGIRFELVDVPEEIQVTETPEEAWNAGVKSLASSLLGLSAQEGSSGDTAAPTAGEDPAVLGADAPAVLVAGEIETVAHHPV